MARLEKAPDFTFDEISCPLTGLIKVEKDFLEQLQKLRTVYSHPMYVTSGCRSIAHNIDVGGHPDSLHMMDNPKHQVDTCAVDIRRPEGWLLARLIKWASLLGWSIGIMRDGVHLDRRVQYVGLKRKVFTYYDTQP